MMTTNNKIKSIFFALVLAIALPVLSNAQPMPDSNDVDTPIDGGLTLLVAAGAAIGAKKVRDSRKK